MKKLIIILLAVAMFSGCATTSIQKADGTTITNSSLFVTTKDISMIDGNTEVTIGNQKIDITSLQALINLMGATSKRGVVNPNCKTP